MGAITDSHAHSYITQPCVTLSWYHCYWTPLHSIDRMPTMSRQIIFLSCISERITKQVYLLMPMKCATLRHAKINNTTLHAKWNRRAAMLRAIFKAHCYTNCHLSVISTYIHGKAQSPLSRFVVDVLYKQVCNKYTRNQTDGVSPLVYQQHCRWEK